MEFEWSALAFASKKPIEQLNATFIAAPRHISQTRIKQLVKQYLPKGNIVIGIAREPYVLGFEDQPQFTMLDKTAVMPLVHAVEASESRYKISLLEYTQRDLPYILAKPLFKQVLLVNGSWKYAFHHTDAYYALASSHTPYRYISPFSDEQEAKDYEVKLQAAITIPTPAQCKSESDLMRFANQIGHQSYDYTYQTGAILARASGKVYSIVATAYNKVLPYQTSAMHHGSERERHYSPAHDLNHYDAIHAEALLVADCLKRNIATDSCSLYINLLPCPTCALLISQTNIAEIVYSQDHSDGYAVKLLTNAGKQVRRLVL